jgi:hypothetical protein
MRKLSLALALLPLCAAVSASGAELTLPRPSPKATVTQTVGLTDISVSYSRPGVKGRTIWGDLVPYDKVWRTGANEATTVTFSKEVEIQGNKLPAGTYSLHTIPTASSWTVIFNKDVDQWGSYSYKAESDALRVKVTPRQAAQPVEWMTFGFPAMSPSGDTAELVLSWDRIEVPIAIKALTVEQAFAAIDKARTDARSDAWRIPYRAADFAFNAGVKLDEAMTWVDQSLAAETNYFNLQLKAKLLAKKGDAKGALATAEKALALQKASGSPPDTAPLEKLVSEWKVAAK